MAKKSSYPQDRRGHASSPKSKQGGVSPMRKGKANEARRGKASPPTRGHSVPMKKGKVRHIN